MESAPDSGPTKKPTPKAPSGTRKPAAPRKPAARGPAAKPTTGRPAVKPAAKVVPKTAPAAAPEPVAVEPPVVEAPAVETPAVETPAADPKLEPETPAKSSALATVAKVGKVVVVWREQFAAASAARTAARKAEVDAKAPSVAVAEKPQPLSPKPARKPRKGSAVVLSVRGLTKSFDDKVAVSGIDLEVKVGAFYGIVGPNGAGKTTTLSMITGLLRPDSGSVSVNGSDVWTDTVQAKRMMGVLPDRLRLFDRLTGAQLLYYAGVLRGLDDAVVRSRTTDLADAFGLEDALGRLVSDYSAGMTKKIALAAAMIHSPRLLVLDEPFESVDPVSAATVTNILKKYVAAGGTVVLSSHSMDLVQRICDNVAVVVHGKILAEGTMAKVRNGQTLEDRFVQLAGGRTSVEGLEWLHSFSD